MTLKTVADPSGPVVGAFQERHHFERTNSTNVVIVRSNLCAGTLPAFADRDMAAKRIAGLSARQRQVLECVLAGWSTKSIAAQLLISTRTVDNHRAAIMRKTGAKSLVALVVTALAALSINN